MIFSLHIGLVGREENQFFCYANHATALVLELLLAYSIFQNCLLALLAESSSYRYDSLAPDRRATIV